MKGSLNVEEKEKKEVQRANVRLRLTTYRVTTGRALESAHFLFCEASTLEGEKRIRRVRGVIIVWQMRIIQVKAIHDCFMQAIIHIKI